MKEHGVINRCLHIYEEGIRRIQANQDLADHAFAKTAELARCFVEEYHEKKKEQHSFPVFRKAGRMTGLVETLLAQHQAGRTVTAQILQFSAPAAWKDPANRTKVADCCRSFIRMYRPHEAREDTVLFPALRTILSPNEVEKLGERMEEAEKKVLGDEGFEKSVDEVASIEKALGIYDLAQFIPKIRPP